MACAFLGWVTPEKSYASNISASETEVKKSVAKMSWKTVSVKKGDSFVKLLKKNGISAKQALKIYRAVKKTYNPAKNLKIGQKLYLSFLQEEKKKTLKSIQIPVSHRQDIVIEDLGKGFKAKKVDKDLQTDWVYKKFTINNSITTDGQKIGVPYRVLTLFVEHLSFEIDFQRELKKGDQVELVYEKIYDPVHHKYSYGGIVYASLKKSKENRKLEIFRYMDKKGRVAYYNQKGHSIQRALTKTPLKAVRISSHFGKRKHPILGYTRMHKGVDFAAPIGTPIYAAGDGKVVFAGRKGAYGIFIKIRHNSTYQTAYAHLSKIAKNIRKNKYVEQGDVIGYVGSTGSSTGPHLHYEIIKNGKHINPIKAKFSSAKKISQREMQRFKVKTEMVMAFVQNQPEKVRYITQKERK